MRYIYFVALIILLLFLMHRRETFSLSGYTKQVGPIKFDDPRPDLSGYTEAEVNINNDTIQEFVLQTNNEISKRTGVCTYIIETTSIKKYSGGEADIYECMFMVVKNNGFAFGFSVTSYFELMNGKASLKALRSQPVGIQAPDDVTPFVDGMRGKDFIEYNLVRETAIPTKSELDSVKNNLQ